MSDLVERVARAIYIQVELHGKEDVNFHHLRAVFGPDARDDYKPYGDSARKAAQAAIAAMQTNATPALKPAVEVWREASDAATDGSVKYQSHADQAAAAVIEADRAAIIAAKDAEIAALKGQLAQQAEDNADLPTIAYFAGAADARDRLTALQAHADAMAEALGEVMEWIAGWTPDFTQDAEWPDTREKVSLALRAYEEFRR